MVDAAISRRHWPPDGFVLPSASASNCLGASWLGGMFLLTNSALRIDDDRSRTGGYYIASKDGTRGISRDGIALADTPRSSQG